MSEDLYQYIKIHRLYYCLKQNPLLLVWFLLFNNGAFQLRSELNKKKVIKTVIRFFLYQLCGQNNSVVLEQPIFGNLCLPVHRGYKIFDFHNKKVIRLISPKVNSSLVAQEINRVRKASSLPFAPNVLRWNIKKRWYEEDFVNGHPCYTVAETDSDVLLEMFHKEITPCLERMILLQSPLSLNLEKHVSNVLASIKNTRLSKLDLDTNKINRIRLFADRIFERISHQKNGRIFLVPSHGDYSLVNILKTKAGIKVIDWEGFDFRNPLFDLYNYFFTEVYYKRYKANLHPVIHEAISSMALRMKEKLPSLAKTLVPLADIYRRLYYLERIRVLLDREPSNNLLDVILRSIKIFNSYENSQECISLS